nr:hypothetical protein BaRGS_002796 [Batillaria attramentaria]
MTAGTIAQGLTPSELSSTDMKLDYLSALGQKEGWTEPQEEAAFNKWLTSENSGKASSITGDQLSQLGHFVCGAKPEIIRSIPASAYKEAMSEIGDVSCSMAKRKEWANLAVKSLGPVTSWSSDQSAAVGSVMAGLSSSQMSKLSLNQLSQMELDTFKMIPPAEFNSLTVEQLKGLSSAHAQTVTEEQAKLLSPEKRKALIALGSTITAPAVSNDAAGSGAPGLSMTIPIVVFCTVVVILAITDI